MGDEEKLAIIKDLASKIALTVRLLTVLQTATEKSQAQDTLEGFLIKFAEELSAPPN